MPLYRLDYLNDDGTTGDAVGDQIGMPFLSRHMATARAAGIAAAAAGERAILVTRIGKAGATRGALVILPDGTCKSPPGSVSDCKATPDGPPCFCPNCRAGRRA